MCPDRPEKVVWHTRPLKCPGTRNLSQTLGGHGNDRGQAKSVLWVLFEVRRGIRPFKRDTVSLSLSMPMPCTQMPAAEARLLRKPPTKLQNCLDTPTHPSFCDASLEGDPSEVKVTGMKFPDLNPIPPSNLIPPSSGFNKKKSYLRLHLLQLWLYRLAVAVWERVQALRRVCSCRLQDQHERWRTSFCILTCRIIRPAH